MCIRDRYQRETILSTDQLEESSKLPSEEDVRLVIGALKNKSPGDDQTETEMLKYGGDMLVKRLHNLIERIWIERKMPRDWGFAIICPVYKKNDKSVCENYHGITLLSIIYRVLAKILA